jgi:hypothetical protein
VSQSTSPATARYWLLAQDSAGVYSSNVSVTI